jgi:hypothetical protein
MNQVNCITAVTYRLVAQDAMGQNAIQARPVEVEHVLIRFGVNGTTDTRKKNFKYLAGVNFTFGASSFRVPAANNGKHRQVSIIAVRRGELR